MLAYDRKQILAPYRWLLPAVLFVVIVIMARLDVLQTALESKQDLANGTALKFVIETLQSDAALLVAPVLCAVPYAAAFADELRSGMIKGVLCRIDSGRYSRSKAIACMVAGGLEELAAIGILLLLSLILLIRLEAAPEAGADQNELIRQMIGLTCRYVSFGFFWSLVGCLMSILTMNRLMAWIGPFIIDYLLIIVYERYFNGIMLIYPKQWLVMTWEWPFADAGVCIWLLLLCCGLVLLITRMGKKVLSRVL